MNTESEEELEVLALSFIASQSHFGSIKTVGLVQGDQNKAVTLAEKKHEFVRKLYSWYLTGEQLKRQFTCTMFNMTLWLECHTTCEQVISKHSWSIRLWDLLPSYLSVGCLTFHLMSLKSFFVGNLK